MRRGVPLLAAWAALAAAGARGAPPAPAPDPDIQKIVTEVSAANIQRSIYVLASFKTRHTLSDPQPTGDGIGGAEAWLQADFQRLAAASGGRLHLDQDSFVQPPEGPAIPRPVTIVNFSATLPGSRPDAAGRTYVIVAHYDSRAEDPLDTNGAAPGADADAAGVAAVLELARVMPQYDFPATLVFLVVAGGEQGCVGSDHWAGQARQAGRDLAGVIDLDRIGRTRTAAAGVYDRSSLRVFAGSAPPIGSGAGALALLRAGGENDVPARELARAIPAIAARYLPAMAVRLIFRADPDSGGGGDQLPFLKRGWPAVRFTEAVWDRGLRWADDQPALLDFAYAADVARVAGAVVGELALSPAPPSGAAVEPGEIAAEPAVAGEAENGDAIVRWSPEAGPGLAAYRVVWRSTAAPLWEHALDVSPKASRAVIRGVAADNALFGVEAVNAAGRSSPAAWARLESK